MKVIGTGLGRTGTYSLRTALNELGLGPCFHMEEVLMNQPVQVPLWVAAARAAPDWETIFSGYQSAVDWPACRFFKELYAEYPDAKFVHTIRTPESWADSFTETIYTLLSGPEAFPPEMMPWLDMSREIIEQTGFPMGLDRDRLMAGFLAHSDAVRLAIPRDQLLIYKVSDGWDPLCKFLKVPVPDTDFPRTNNRIEFWDR